MTLKVPVNPLLKGGLYLLAAFGVLNFIVGVYFTFFEGGVAWEESIGLIVGLVIFLIGFIPAKTIKPSKSKMYKEYSRVALSYQIKD